MWHLQAAAVGTLPAFVPPPSNDLPLTPNVNSLIKILARAAVTVPRVLCNNYSRDKCSPGDTGQHFPPAKARLSINHCRRGHRTQRAAGYWCEQLQHFQVLCSAIPNSTLQLPSQGLIPALTPHWTVKSSRKSHGSGPEDTALTPASSWPLTSKGKTLRRFNY